MIDPTNGELPKSALLKAREDHREIALVEEARRRRAVLRRCAGGWLLSRRGFREVKLGNLQAVASAVAQLSGPGVSRNPP